MKSHRATRAPTKEDHAVESEESLPDLDDGQRFPNPNRSASNMPAGSLVEEEDLHNITWTSIEQLGKQREDGDHEGECQATLSDSGDDEELPDLKYPDSNMPVDNLGESESGGEGQSNIPAGKYTSSN